MRRGSVDGNDDRIVPRSSPPNTTWRETLLFSRRRVSSLFVLLMEPLNLPTYEFRTTDQGGKRQIYDPIRQRYVRLTPEEWVRQHFLQYLIQDLDIPSGLLATEAPFQYDGQSWRADIVAHDRQGDPLLLVECKAPSVSIGQDAFDQGSRYNLVLNAPFLVVTNGHVHYACHINLDAQDYTFLDKLPPYDALLQKRQ